MTRIESDPMGSVEVPDGAYWGAHTQRAVSNFQFSNLRFGRRFIWAHAVLKSEAARVNAEMGMLEAATAKAIIQAAEEVAEGRFDDQFVVDLFQTGSGTSSNMNANEVIANRATEILGGDLGSKLVHPNDHVNLGQSSNDTIPTSIHLAAVAGIHEELLPALAVLGKALREKANAFDHVVKTGRTHLMDAPPIRFGQEFGGLASQIEKSIARVEAVLPQIEELALGGTVVGTGINAEPGFAERVIARLAERTGYPLRPAEDNFEALGAKDGAVMVSGALRAVALSLFKIANDIRWLNSGPVSGLGEIRLAPLQPGSSIIPGMAKVNAVVCEAVMMAVAQVLGNDGAVAWAAGNGNFQLNVMMPVLAHNLHESISLLATSARSLAEKTVQGLEVDEDRCLELLERNVTLVTALTPLIGYDAAAEVGAVALEQRRPVREVAVELTELSVAEVDEALDLTSLTDGGRLTAPDGGR